MNELELTVRQAEENADPAWDGARVEASLARLERRIRRRVVIRRTALISAPVLVALGVLVWTSIGGPSGASQEAQGVEGRTAQRETQETRTVESPRTLQLADGSTATPEDEESEVVAARVTDRDVTVRLTRGGARFEVQRNHDRSFRVDAGLVSVVVMGTSFSVRRIGPAVEVQVFEGQVRVEWEGGSQTLWAGGRNVYPPPALTEATEELEAAPEQQPTSASTRRNLDWRTLAERGDYDDARDALEGQTVRDDMDDLLLAADVMRYSRQPGRAAEYLERAIDVDPSDRRAPLAHFTLGRIFLHQLNRPRDAARAFARCQALAPSGSLAEDALAREVEAWHRAGERRLARERAIRYEQNYPNGPRLPHVRRLGGLD